MLDGCSLALSMGGFSVGARTLACPALLPPQAIRPSAGGGLSSGSACTSHSLDPSHVILAMGLPFEVAHGTLRFTLGKTTNEKGIDKLLEVLPGIVEALRQISPVNLTVEEVTK